jgi:5-(carboxyamino)imidazole ribonucleotide mutase
MEEMKVLVLVGSRNDLPVMNNCLEMLARFGIPGGIEVASAHRSPERVESVLAEAEEAGAEVVVAGAGMSAALPGVVASRTSLPVIGVPLDSGLPGGIDALLSMAQMPTGVPVATVAVGGARNAAVLAAKILALKYPGVKESLEEYRRELAESD